MYSSETIGRGVVHSACKKEPHGRTLVWSGAIAFSSPPQKGSREGLSSAFEVSGLKVVVSAVRALTGCVGAGTCLTSAGQDSILLQIEPPVGGGRPQHLPLNETIPVRLTSDSVKCTKAVSVSSVG